MEGQVHAMRRYIGGLLGLSVAAGTAAGAVAAAPAVASSFVAASEALVVSETSITAGALLSNTMTEATGALVCAAQTSVATATTVFATNAHLQQKALDTITSMFPGTTPVPNWYGLGGLATAQLLPKPPEEVLR